VLWWRARLRLRMRVAARATVRRPRLKTDQHDSLADADLLASFTGDG
jgi:hypothetical protein